MNSEGRLAGLIVLGVIAIAIWVVIAFSPHSPLHLINQLLQRLAG